MFYLGNSKKSNPGINSDEKEDLEESDADEENGKSTEKSSLNKENILEQLKALVIKEGKDDDFNDDFSDDSENDLDSIM